MYTLTRTHTHTHGHTHGDIHTHTRTYTPFFGAFVTDLSVELNICAASPINNICEMHMYTMYGVAFPLPSQQHEQEGMTVTWTIVADNLIMVSHLPPPGRIQLTVRVLL